MAGRQPAAGLALYARIDLAAIDDWRDVLPATVMASVAQDHVGTASGFNPAVARIAGLVATATRWLTSLAAFRMAALVGAASAALAAVCAILMIKSQPSPKPVAMKA
eukprot:gene1824-1854_t